MSNLKKNGRSIFRSQSNGRQRLTPANGFADQFIQGNRGLGNGWMNEGHTTIVMERHLGKLAELEDGAAAEPIIRELIDVSVSRLHFLCRALLMRSYPRLTRPPLNLQSEELLSAVVHRLLRAMRQIRPATVRQFFGLANRHMRWELNDFARHLDQATPVAELKEAMVASPVSGDDELTPNARRILEAIERLPEEEREAFDLIRIQNLTQPEAAKILGISDRTLRRRLNRGLLLLTEQLSDLEFLAAPDGGD